MARLASWLLNFAYLFLLTVATPWIAWQAWRTGKYRAGSGAKFFGRVPPRADNSPCLWLHAVSVGEVNLAAATLERFAARSPNWQIVVSTTTKAGYELAVRKYADRFLVCYCPLDFSWAVRTAMQRIRPTLLVLAELELWPNLILEARRRDVPVAIINGRLSDRSFRGYRRFRPLVAPLLRQLDRIAAQDQQTADRFLALGADPHTVLVTGSLKYDGAITERRHPRVETLRKLAGIAEGDPVWLAGSTQAPEEVHAIDIYQKLVGTWPQLRLILAPRHPERFEEAARLLDRSGLRWERRTALGGEQGRGEGAAPVLLVDVIGELAAWWGTATIGFVGGSFGNRGGQNMIEPAALGVATCFGPNTWNFRDITTQLLRVDGARRVATVEELESFVRRVLQEPAWGSALGARGRSFVLSQQGAVAQTVELLESLGGSAAGAAIAEQGPIEDPATDEERGEGGKSGKSGELQPLIAGVERLGHDAGRHVDHH
jgi:3-deoxy-D-manno-octulosonic-acid transferase